MKSVFYNFYFQIPGKRCVREPSAPSPAPPPPRYPQHLLVQQPPPQPTLQHQLRDPPPPPMSPAAASSSPRGPLPDFSTVIGRYLVRNKSPFQFIVWCMSIVQLRFSQLPGASSPSLCGPPGGGRRGRCLQPSPPGEPGRVPDGIRPQIPVPRPLNYLRPAAVAAAEAAADFGRRIPPPGKGASSPP